VADTITPVQLAVALWGERENWSRSPRARDVRRKARELFPDQWPGQGRSWALTPQMQSQLRDVLLSAEGTASENAAAVGANSVELDGAAERRERKRFMRELRRTWLTELGWTVIQDGVVYAPNDPDRSAMYSLAAAAQAAGLPADLDELSVWTPSAATSQRSIGTDWKPAAPTIETNQARQLTFDPAKLERGTKSHIAIEKQLARALVVAGTQPLSPRNEDPQFDIAWEVDDGRLIVAEIKSTTLANEEHQLRLGLGQVLRYRFELRQRFDREVDAWLVPERAPRDGSWFELTKALDVRLVPAPNFEHVLNS
jgi:hypothetical protein